MAAAPPAPPGAAEDAAADANAPAAAAKRSPNVPLTLLYKALDALASGIWASGATSAYILLLFAGTSTSATVAIGSAQALQGAMIALVALPLAWAADKWGRARVARFAGALALLAAALTSAAVLWPEEGGGGGGGEGGDAAARQNGQAAAAPAASAAARSSFRLLCGALAVWGAAAGVGPTVDALFADSLPTGARARWFHLAYALSLASRSVGPLAAALLFWRSGDEWRLPVLRRVILAGQAAAVLPAAALFLLRDDAALGEESEGMLAGADSLVESRLPSMAGPPPPPLAVAAVASSSSLSASLPGSSSSSSLCRAGNGLSEPLLQAGDAEEQGDEDDGELEAQAHGAAATAAAAAAAAATTTTTAAAARPPPATTPPRRSSLERPQRPHHHHHRRRRRRRPLGFLRQRHVPLILATTDLVAGLASGMTVKFMSIFFIEQVGLPPTAVNLMQASAPLLIALASAGAERAARRGGRVQAMLAVKAAGVALLFWLARDRALWRRPWPVAAVFLARTALMNAAYPLSRSILSDYVPKARRARWNALESVTAFSWSGSAAAGGWIIERRGFAAAFSATAALQAVALAGQLLLLPLVPRREGGVLAVAAAAANGR